MSFVIFRFYFQLDQRMNESEIVNLPPV